ncbi:MAG: amidohydrolase, partial [Synergistaceae bacterium]|nr:amidohydrolase [Synergistaceae bacterium]
IFQPSEETINGALSMIASGALENPNVDEVIGLHTGNIWDGLEPGQIGWRTGPMMAATSTLAIVFEGRGGHGATPHLTVDPIVIATEAIGQLQTLVSREISPFEPAVLTIGKIAGGTAPNVIAGSCELRGTIRSFNPKIDAFLKKRIRETVEGVAASMRGRGTVSFSADIPAVINVEACVLKMRDIVAKTLGEKWVKEIALPSSGAEDFAFYLEKVPGAFFYHCATFEPSPDGTERNYPHHNSKFDVNESVLWTGSAAMAAYALNWQGWK